MFVAPRIARDRQAREDGPTWAKCWSKSKGWFYHNVETEGVQWEQPEDYEPRADSVQAAPLEVRLGVARVFEGFHCKNLISRFYSLIELGDAVLNNGGYIIISGEVRLMQHG